MEYTYEFGGKTYIQRPLVLGQLRQLLKVLKNVEIPGDATALGLIEAFGDKIQDVLAVVLTEQGTSLKDKNLTALADDLAFSVTPETAFQVCEDFFSCNPVSSLLERLTGAMGKITGTLPPIGLATSSLSSAPAISPAVMPSSGDTD